VALGVGSEFKTQYQKKKEREKEIEFGAGCWLLTLVILASQLAEIKRMTVQSQPE
jgi:hypothetical protein